GKGEAANGSLSLPHRNDYHYFRCIFYFLEVPKQIEAAVQAVCFSYLTINPVSSEKLKHYLESNRITIEKYQAEYQNILPFFTNLLQDTNIKNRFNNDLEKFRKNKKNHYWMNSGTMKLSTIYSFKGWEVDTLFLIIEKGAFSDYFAIDELIYTALTRCRNNLFILDCDQSRYAKFFKTALNGETIPF
ncbi:hypothetical protein, partial [Nostoc sp.]|uniref:hypothetical protein n=1 Tax=Nostoc sp. TaxID=1180 RepID=UPI002FF92571